MRRFPARLPAKIAAALLSLSLAAPAFAVPAAARSCCCKHAAHKCHCPVCEHARELESGQRHFKQCGDGEGAILPRAHPAALPAAERVVVAPVSREPAPMEAPDAPHDPPQQEVPSPPPQR